METIQLLPYSDILDQWKRSKMDIDSAKFLTLNQVEAFENIVCDDEGWKYLLSVFNNGRDVDAWLALDWPEGFDELLLCVPLCKLVEFECSKCTIGRRQDNNSCAHDYSLFGYIAELLNNNDRLGLKDHIISIKKILLFEHYRWDVTLKKLDES